MSKNEKDMVEDLVLLEAMCSIPITSCQICTELVFPFSNVKCPVVLQMLILSELQQEVDGSAFLVPSLVNSYHAFFSSMLLR